jgi:hypothetical protein
MTSDCGESIIPFGHGSTGLHLAGGCIPVRGLSSGKPHPSEVPHGTLGGPCLLGARGESAPFSSRVTTVVRSGISYAVIGSCNPLLIFWLAVMIRVSVPLLL